MPAAPLSIELAREALEALSKAGGNQSEAARSLNLDRGTFMGRIRTGHRYALEGKFGTDPVIPGFEIKKTSAELDEDGNVKREWVQQVPEKGDEFALPPRSRHQGRLGSRRTG